MAELTLEGVSKTYGGSVLALAPTSFTVHDGQFIVLVGPSGCGKSTLLRIIAGLETATSGAISMDGRRIESLPPKERDVAMVFQNYALYPHMTVRENLDFPLRMRSRPKDERSATITEVAAVLQLTELLDRRPAQLSGGQQQRVALGRAVVRRPKLFLLDEPFSNLDASLRASTRTELLQLHRRIGSTALFVTHDQVEAMSMADVLVVFRSGVVQQIGAPLDVYRKPANPFVAQFIGSPPMNLIEATVSHAGEALRIGDQTAEMPPDLLGSVAGSLVLGLRAEHIRLAPAYSSERGMFKANVVLLEPLGNETLVTTRLEGQEVILRAPASTRLEGGSPVLLDFDLRHASWFDGKAGVALSTNSADQLKMPRS